MLHLDQKSTQIQLDQIASNEFQIPPIHGSQKECIHLRTKSGLRSDLDESWGYIWST